MMTKAIATVLIAGMALVALPQPTAYAGDEEWATAGKILAGVVGAVIIHEIATSGDHYRRAPARRYYRREPVRRVRYVRSPPRYRRAWVPGHYETRCERVWIEGYWERVWVPPQYKMIRVITYDRCGYERICRKRVLVEEGHYERVWHEGYWDMRKVREWVPGRWEYR